MNYIKFRMSYKFSLPPNEKWLIYIALCTQHNVICITYATYNSFSNVSYALRMVTIGVFKSYMVCRLYYIAFPYYYIAQQTQYRVTVYQTQYCVTVYQTQYRVTAYQTKYHVIEYQTQYRVIKYQTKYCATISRPSIHHVIHHLTHLTSCGKSKRLRTASACCFHSPSTHQVLQPEPKCIRLYCV
jgi:hypothetical protein